MDIQKKGSSTMGQASKTKLRSGFTTGTCAAAAAKAAAVFLLLKKREQNICIVTPKGVTAKLPIASWEKKDREAVCMVVKDSGDDPDVTNQAAVFSSVEVVTFFTEQWLKAGYVDPEFPNLCLIGGEGIGIITKNGLSSPVGKYAINPVPRKMILKAVTEVCREADFNEKILITISIPEGKALAEKTFNPKLGIIGGISILGTSGIVEPMSENAILETIRLEIHMKAAEGKKQLTVTPGNYGETFLRQAMGSTMDDVVKCGNFIGETMEFLAGEGIEQVLLAGHIGKLIKVAGGAMNTHSRYGDRRMEILKSFAELGGADRELGRKILTANTTEEAIEYLMEDGLLRKTMDMVVRKIKENLEGHAKGISVEVVTFSTVYGILGKTKLERQEK